MNFAVFTTFLLILLITQTPSITGLKSAKSSQQLASEQDSILNKAKLVLSLDSGDSLVRRPRDSSVPQADKPLLTEKNEGSKTGAASNEKRSKNSGHGGGNKKLSRNQDVNTPIGVRNKHHMDKKLINAGEQQPTQQQQQQHHQHMGKRQQQIANRQQHGSNKNNNNNKQRQLLKSQQHQEHQSGKRNNGHKIGSETNGNGNDNGGKMQSTCRYTKSSWSECDPRSNTHSRTLTLKRGDNNCPPTRTIQKKCKKTCRYEKGTWSECKDGQMIREDKLKISANAGSAAVSGLDSNCEAIRSVNRKCNPDTGAGKSSKSHQNGNAKTNKKDRKNKEKANNRGTQQT